MSKHPRLCNGFYPTRKSANAAMFRVIAKCNRLGLRTIICVRKCPQGFYLHGAAYAK